MSASCRSCQAPVLWLDHETTGTSTPVDAEPHPHVFGNIVVDAAAGTYRVVAGDERQAMIERGDPLHLNHFVTCPQSAAWKSKR